MSVRRAHTRRSMLVFVERRLGGGPSWAHACCIVSHACLSALPFPSQTQDTVLFNDSILHNVAYGRPGASMGDVRTAAAAAKLDAAIARMPAGEARFMLLVQAGGRLLCGWRTCIGCSIPLVPPCSLACTKQVGMRGCALVLSQARLLLVVEPHQPGAAAIHCHSGGPFLHRLAHGGGRAWAEAERRGEATGGHRPRLPQVNSERLVSFR